MLLPPQEQNTESLTHKASVLAREMDVQQEGESKAKAGRGGGSEGPTLVGYAETRAELPRHWDGLAKALQWEAHGHLQRWTGLVSS